MFKAVVSCLEQKFEITKQSKTHSHSTGTSLYFYLDGIWAALHGSELNPVPCHFVFWHEIGNEWSVVDTII
jgi:hypothetical protein